MGLFFLHKAFKCLLRCLAPIHLLEGAYASLRKPLVLMKTLVIHICHLQQLRDPLQVIDVSSRPYVSCDPDGDPMFQLW